MTGGNSEHSRLVYSSEGGRVAEPRGDRAPAHDPGDGVVRVSRSKAGRKGKTVTLVTGLPYADLEPVAKELKRHCGAGGAVKDGAVELQGDHREKVIARLSDRYRVKPAGG